MRVELLTGGVGVPCPRFLTALFFLAALLLRTLKVDTVEHLVETEKTSEMWLRLSYDDATP